MSDLLLPTPRNILKVGIRKAKGPDKLLLMKALNKLPIALATTYYYLDNAQELTDPAVDKETSRVISALKSCVVIYIDGYSYVRIMAKERYNNQLICLRQPSAIKFHIMYRDMNKHEKRVLVPYAKLKNEIATPVCQWVSIQRDEVPTYSAVQSYAGYHVCRVVRFVKAPKAGFPLDKTDTIIDISRR